MKRAGIFFLTAVFIATALVYARNPAQPVFEGDWSNPNRGVRESVFAFEKLEDAIENQTSLWIARFDDGSYFYAYLFNYKFTIYEKWGAAAVLVDPDGERHMGKVEIPRGDLNYSKDSITFKSRNVRISGGNPVYKFFMDAEGFRADLTYSNVVPPFAPGKGTAWYDAEKKTFLTNVSHCPWGIVSGTLSFNGETRRVNGQGYADRDHANQLFTKQIKELHSFRGWPRDVKDGYGMSAIEYISGPQYNGLRASWLILMKKGEIVMATPEFDVVRSNMKRDEVTGFEYPLGWRLAARDGDNVLEGAWCEKKTIDILDVFNELPAPLRPIARRFFTRPVFYRMTGDFIGRFKNGEKSVPLRIEGLYKAVYTR